MRLLLPLCLVVACCHAPPPPSDGSAPAPLVRSHVGLETRDGGKFAVKVELALTHDEREVGLMNRATLGPDDGMLFVFAREAKVSFWMHNTLVPLDMIFISNGGRIVGIVADAAPLTDTPRQVGAPSRYVLEVNGGYAASHGLRVGDRVVLGDALAAARAHGGGR